MNDKNKNLVLRLATAFICLPIILWLVGKGGWPCAVMLGLAAAVCASEYYVMVQQKLSPAACVGIAVALVLPLLPVWAESRAGELAFWCVAAFFLFSWIYYLLRGPLPEAPTLAAHLMMGLLFGAVGLMSLSAVRQRPDGLGWVICALVITWLNDTVAYFAGRLLGKHKLYPAVSPNKTWEGFMGGWLGSVVGMFVVRATFFPALTLLDCLIVGALGGLLGPLGDLCESMLKRAYGAKDSGKIIPGHGGVLDRIDALVFNAPLVYLYAQFVHGTLP